MTSNYSTAKVNQQGETRRLSCIFSARVVIFLVPLLVPLHQSACGQESQLQQNANVSRNSNGEGRRKNEYAQQQRLNCELQVPCGDKKTVLDLVLIPPGDFVMGSEVEIPENAEERPVHSVRITKAFYIGKYEVTQEQYVAVTKKRNPSYFAPAKVLEFWRRPVTVYTPRRPVDSVSWDDAVSFCKSLGPKYRLPTEAEWEYACRAGSAGPFWFGESDNGTMINCFGLAPFGTIVQGQNLHLSTEVGKYQANDFGLFDMHGNMEEWCSDAFQENYYENSPAIDPCNSKLSASLERVVRGGSWTSVVKNCRSASRRGVRQSERSYTIGFRVVRDVD